MTATDDAGVIAVLVERLEKQRLPRALALQAKVSQGQTLDDFDIAFLDEVFADSNTIKPMLARHPEYQELVGKIVSLYLEITEKGLANEKAQGGN